MLYDQIIFMQDEAAGESLKILEEEGEQKAMDHLMQWDYGDNVLIDADLPHGTRDTTYRSGDYIMSYNKSIGYIGLIKLEG